MDRAGAALAPEVAQRSRVLPLATSALGGLAYLLLATLVDFAVVRRPGGNYFLHVALLVLLGLAFVATAEGFLGLIQAISRSEMLGWPFRAAALASVAYSFVYAHSVFVNYWYYDDWGYLRDAPLSKALILSPLNDHFVPLLRFVLWADTRLFGLDYIGAACLQQSAFLIIALVLAHLLWKFARRPWLLIVLVGLFGMWPSYGIARTWFAGGFWLTASTALLAVYVLHTRQIMSVETLHFADASLSAALASATVFISSQTLAPAIYLLVFFVPALLFSRRRSVHVGRLAILCAISLAPTALALWGRRTYVARGPLDPSGLLDGQLFVNLGVFMVNKVLFATQYKAWLPVAELLVLFALPLAVAARKLVTSPAVEPDHRADLAGLILGGGAMFAISLAQIGLARRWSPDAIQNPYYVTLPFLGLWLAWAGIGLTLLPGPRVEASARFSRSAALATAVIFVLAAVTAAAQPYQQPLVRRLQLIHTERQFIDSLGTAVCDLARIHRDGPAVRWVPALGMESCSVCLDIIGPLQFQRDLGFDSLVSIAARERCPEADWKKVDGGGAPSTDGNESAAARSFLHTYFKQPVQGRGNAPDSRP